MVCPPSWPSTPSLPLAVASTSLPRGILALVVDVLMLVDFALHV